MCPYSFANLHCFIVGLRCTTRWIGMHSDLGLADISVNTFVYCTNDATTILPKLTAELNAFETGPYPHFSFAVLSVECWSKDMFFVPGNCRGHHIVLNRNSWDRKNTQTLEPFVYFSFFASYDQLFHVHCEQNLPVSCDHKQIILCAI